MAGTKAGAVGMAKKLKARYGEDHFKRIGAMGGRVSRKGGFYANRTLASQAGRKGGSRRKGSS